MVKRQIHWDVVRSKPGQDGVEVVEEVATGRNGTSSINQSQSCAPDSDHSHPNPLTRTCSVMVEHYYEPSYNYRQGRWSIGTPAVH
jgi:hypothetical protein